MFRKPKPLEVETAAFLEEEPEGVRSVPPENRTATRAILGGHAQVTTGQPGCSFPAPLAPLPRQWSQIQVQHELGTTGQVGTETGVLRWQRSTLGGRSGCAGPSSLTREGEPLLPHKGVV